MNSDSQSRRSFLGDRVHFWFCLFAAAMLLLALARLPYGYYTFLRLVVSLTAVGVAGCAAACRRWYWAVPLAALALLFNPLIPVHLTREIWRPINVGAAVLMIVVALALRLPMNGDDEDTTG